MRWFAESRPCPICESEESVFVGTRGGRAHRHHKGVETTVVRCKRCLAFYTSPTLLPESNPYAELTRDEYFAGREREGAILPVHESIARRAGELLGRPGRMLDLGCGRGEILAAATRLGWTGQGVEMTESFAAFVRSRGIPVEVARIEDCRALEETHDVIVMTGILEHVYDPPGILRRVAMALNAGGFVYLNVPNEGSLALRMAHRYLQLRKGRDWTSHLSPTFAPFHVVGYQLRSVQVLLERVGLEPVELATEQWDNVQPGQLPMAERLSLGVLLRAGPRLGMGDGIKCWARKPMR